MPSAAMFAVWFPAPVGGLVAVIRKLTIILDEFAGILFEIAALCR